jgi:5-oxoprolinase (ATP-hydrolysing)
MHAYLNPAHEIRAAEIARDVGFEQISPSHEASRLIKLVGRGDTAVVDAYLSPILRRYVRQVADALDLGQGGCERLYFMQSNGGLTDARCSRGATRSCRGRRAASSAWCARGGTRGSTG